MDLSCLSLGDAFFMFFFKKDFSCHDQFGNDAGSSVVFVAGWRALLLSACAEKTGGLVVCTDEIYFIS